MSQVFGHGRLRLYLLRLLAEEPRHGYEVIQLLRERFDGLYEPSAGTIYPRLSKLAEEGLIVQSRHGGRKVYEITDAGRAELKARQAELSALDQELEESMHSRVEDVREEVHGAVRDMHEELKQAASQMRRSQRSRKRGSGWSWESIAVPPPFAQGVRDFAVGAAPAGATPLARDLERRIDSFADHAREAARLSQPTDEQFAACEEVLTSALALLKSALAKGE